MRICLYGGPSSGKSTIAAYMFSQLKMLNYKVELINEYVKNWAYEGRNIRGSDQFYIFAKQWRREDIVLRNGVEHIVTDSPLLLQCAYAKEYNAEGWEEILVRALKIEKKYPSINIFLKREYGKYQTEGRYQTEEKALELDEQFKQFLTDNGVNFKIFPNCGETILEYILDEFNKKVLTNYEYSSTVMANNLLASWVANCRVEPKREN